jgi:hypothetical protein
MKKLFVAKNARKYKSHRRQMRSQSSRISIGDVNAKPHGETLEESCKCDVMQPGLYDIETEMCTPELGKFVITCYFIFNLF